MFCSGLAAKLAEKFQNTSLFLLSNPKPTRLVVGLLLHRKVLNLARAAISSAFPMSLNWTLFPLSLAYSLWGTALAAAISSGDGCMTELRMQKIFVENKQKFAGKRDKQGSPPLTGDRRLGARVVAAAKGGGRRSWAWARRSPVRELWEWARCKRMILPSVQQMAESVAALQIGDSGAINAETRPEAPIFLLATGWRAGSTLLQRILVTDPRVLVWGEPFGDLAFPSKIAEMVGHISELYLLKERFIQDGLTSATMTTSWIATLYPPGDDFRLALRSFFDRWLGDPARYRGFSGWGFKEVRLGAAEATLLHWLYPDAKFLVLSRHPYDCYRSLADSGWNHVYYQRPSVRVDSAAGFARHWNRLALSWSELPEGFPYLHIHYDDLINHKVDFRRLESWLGIEIKEQNALSVFVGKTAVRQRLNWCERLIIFHEAGAGMKALGYSE